MIEHIEKMKCDFCKTYIDRKKEAYSELAGVEVATFNQGRNEDTISVESDDIHLCKKCLSEPISKLIEFIKEEGYRV